MTEYETLVREKIEATIDRARFDTLDPATIHVDVTDSFRRKLGECRPISRSDRDSTPKYEIRIARRLFEDGRDDRCAILSSTRSLTPTFSKLSVQMPILTGWSGRTQHVGQVRIRSLAMRVTSSTRRTSSRVRTDVSSTGTSSVPNGARNPWQYTCDECGTPPISYAVTDKPNDPEPGTCYVASIPWWTQDDKANPDDTRSTVRYLLACPNGCTVWPYQRRTKRIKNPWLYSCSECDATLLSCDIDDHPINLESGRCHVASIPWQEPRIVHACPNGCFSVGYGQRTKESRQPERYRCEECGARTVAYPADDQPEILDPGTNYVE